VIRLGLCVKINTIGCDSSGDDVVGGGRFTTRLRRGVHFCGGGDATTAAG